MTQLYTSSTFRIMTAIYILAAHWFVSLFCQSFFLHRYCSHGMFRMNRFWERFFYLLTFITQGPGFLNPSSYSIMHQRHHAFSDTPKDPHSPANSKTMMEMMLKTYHEYHRLLHTYHLVKDETVVHRSPEWKFLDEFAKGRLHTLLWLPIYPALYYAMDVAPIYYLFIPIHFFVGPIQGAIVNWFGHHLGYRNFNLPDQSKNTLPVDFLLMGELYQNNHHRFAQKFNFATKWFEIDLTYQAARILMILGIIKNKEASS